MASRTTSWPHENGGKERNEQTPSRGMVSMPRELSHTPTIAGLSPTVQTPFIQKCYVHRGSMDNQNEQYQQQQQQQQPLELMTVTFEEEGLQLTTTSLLGKGGFGRVYAARSNSGELYALKASAKKMTESDWSRLRKEVALMNHFAKHPNVVKFIAAGRDEERAYVVMECCASRSLHDVIAQHGLDVQEILWVGWALVDTIAFLHSKGCIHRDLKPQNLLFDFDGNLKITDFGLSSRIAEAQPRKTVAGTAMYMAPEIAEAVYKRMVSDDSQHSLQYGKEVDTWSIGVVLYVMLTRMNPYIQAMEKEGTRDMDKTQKTLALFNCVAGASWSWPADWTGDEELCEIVNRTMHREPSKRATLQEILQHPVWSRRPLSCPLSLLHKLNLLERSLQGGRYGSTRRSLSRVADNLPLPNAKKTVDDVLTEGLRRVALTEQRARAQLVLEHHETLHVIVELLKLLRAEVDCRKSIKEDEERYRMIIKSQMLSRRQRRGGSETLVTSSSTTTTTAGGGVKGMNEAGGIRASRSRRESSVMLVAPTRDEEEDGRIVRASPDKYAVVYPGRETSTRWSLRPVISLPRELNSEIEQFKCMNHHIMTKLTSMPHGYNGFDCNVCDREILKITPETPAFRCYKCDYDLCMKCAYQGRLKDVNFVCVSCAKKFTSAAKLRSHTLQCRGPSWSPSPRRSARMDTLLWEDPEKDKAGEGRGTLLEVGGRRSLLDIRLPDEEPAAGGSSRRGGRPSGRSSTSGRASSGGRISVGDRHVPSPEDVGAMVVKHRDAMFPEMPEWPASRRSTVERGSGSRRGGGAEEEEEGNGKATYGGRNNDKNNNNNKSSDNGASFSFELPPEIRLSRQKKEERVQPRNSAELKDIIEVDTPPMKKGRSERQQERGVSASPYRYNEKGNIVGIAAQHRAAREASLQQQPPPTGHNVIMIRADAAVQPQEMQKQPRVPRSASSSRPVTTASSTITSNTTTTTTTTKIVQQPMMPVTRTVTSTAPLQQQPQQQQQQQQQQPMPQQTRQPSASGMTMRGGPPLPRKGPGMPQNTPRPVPPPANFPVPRQPSRPLPQPGGVGGAGGGILASAGCGSSNAFLALPREEQNRQRFVDEFLSGGWIRFYSFTNEETVVMYYCVQPGRYGAVFPTEAGVGTAVVDVHSKLVLYVPCMNNESTNRSQPHPHVQTFYDEDVRLLGITEAQRYLGGVLDSIMGFVKEIARLRAEGLTPAAVHAAYIHQRERSSVPTDTKFVYVRKVFPDPSGSFTLFRLSNLRSQVVCNALMDIRWQSDRRHNVGQKYYVLADGTAEPFVVDHTGILAQVEAVLSNSFRR
ncbi:protein kinase [Trypanosoma theileri]|uniref:Serine/threonine-protein kinase PLK n=1 Tax=Trypanosoma theileri TaxID=67003 RepID=A0A1X0P360_9TRYP|nr:protein kinase [Trypanosoma theileri]ORC91357.1 protein kinase [Trypanosoma theileri]